ncbi:MAG: hypothetical protein AAF108_07115 [Planctomycetota bacterium]
MISWTDIAEASLAGLVGHAALLDAEHATRGLDALRETDLHPLIETGLVGVGMGVLREHPFPGHPDDPPTTKDSARERCDLVVTERPGLRVFDALERSRVLDAASDGLFAETAALEAGELAPDEITSDEAAWLEVKATAQHAYRDGVPGPNARYSTELTRGPVGDLRKLSKEPGVVLGASLVVLFAETEAVVEHDLAAAAHTLIDSGGGVESAVIRAAPFTDRVGNGAVGVLVASIVKTRGL